MLKKLKHQECIMYRTVDNDFNEEEKKAFDYDMVVFFSPMGVKALYKNFPNFKQDKIKIGTFGQGTAKAAQDEGLELALQAPTPKISIYDQRNERLFKRPRRRLIFVSDD